MQLHGNSYYAAFSLLYLAGFLWIDLIFPMTVLMVLWSYAVILKKRSIIPVLLLIIYARAMVGFSAQGNSTFYLIMNIMVNYLPSVLLMSVSLRQVYPGRALRTYPISYLYFGVMIIFATIGGAAALSLLGNRILPFLIFIILLMRGFERDSVDDLRQMMRWMIGGSVLVIALPGYSDTAAELLRNGTVFGVESFASIMLGGIPRAMGPLWDPRIFGVLCFLNIVLVLSMKGVKPWSFDVLLSLLGLALSLSRGSFVAIAIFFIYFTLVNRNRYGLVILAVIVAMALPLWDVFMRSIVEQYFIVNGVNPLEQRSGFFMYAIGQFIEHPFGQGIGFLRNLSGGVMVGDAFYTAVSDAYIAILLAEIGFVGFAIFIWSLWEIVVGRNPLSPAVFFSLLSQMIGTDVPDFGPPYLVILVICVMISRMKSEKDVPVDPKASGAARQPVVIPA